MGQNLPGYTQRSRQGSFRRHCTLSLMVGDKSRADAAPPPPTLEDIVSFSWRRKSCSAPPPGWGINAEQLLLQVGGLGGTFQCQL